MKENESFKAYAQRWRELATKVEPPLSEKEMIDIFMDNLCDPYFDKLVSSGASGFVNLVVIGDQIEKGLKYCKILSHAGASSALKKLSGNLQKKKKGYTSDI